MSIYEYDQEEHIRLEREDAYDYGRKLGREEGIEEGRKEGIELGEYKKLREQVEKKLKKGLSASEIAEMLEENIDKVEELMKSLQNEISN